MASPAARVMPPRATQRTGGHGWAAGGLYGRPRARRARATRLRAKRLARADKLTHLSAPRAGGGALVQFLLRSSSAMAASMAGTIWACISLAVL
jgi:hypothetical protein